MSDLKPNSVLCNIYDGLVIPISELDGLHWQNDIIEKARAEIDEEQRSLKVRDA